VKVLEILPMIISLFRWGIIETRTTGPRRPPTTWPQEIENFTKPGTGIPRLAGSRRSTFGRGDLQAEITAATAIAAAGMLALLREFARQEAS
jgi:hypothetical protein